MKPQSLEPSNMKQSAGCPWQPSEQTEPGQRPVTPPLDTCHATDGYTSWDNDHMLTPDQMVQLPPAVSYRVPRRWGPSQQPAPTAQTQHPAAGPGVPGGSSDNLRAGALEPGAFQPGATVLMGAPDLAFWTVQCQGLHKEARAALESAITELSADRELASIDLTSGGRWPRWREYLANHKCADKLVAPGITAVTAERLAERDANRGGMPRVDIILHHATGARCRIHPGSRAAGDAQPIYLGPSLT